MKAIAVDIGGTHATCAIIEDAVIKASTTISIDNSRWLAAVLVEIEKAIGRILVESGVRVDECAGCAISFPGIIHPIERRILSTPKEKFEDSKDIDLPAWCEARFSLRLRIENDARMALLGEHFAGAGRSFEDIVMITLGTGVGGAAMIDGKLLRGKHFQAGCLGGHLPVRVDGRICGCGAVGCVEAEASGWALPDIVCSWPEFPHSCLANEPKLNFEALFRCASSGDTVALEVIDHCLRVWAAGITGLIHAYDPELIILGGAVMGSADRVLPFVSEYVRKHSWTPWGSVQVQAAQLGNNAALLGAIPVLSEKC